MSSLNTTTFSLLFSVPTWSTPALRAALNYVGTEKRREKVAVLRELQRVIIYTRELSKQVIEGHVSTAFIGYSVNEGARLTDHSS
jgi:hypothetical protein